jgi:hypothetical protein
MHHVRKFRPWLILKVCKHVLYFLKCFFPSFIFTENDLAVPTIELKFCQSPYIIEGVEFLMAIYVA